MRKAHAADPSYIPDLSHSPTIFTASDFTGDQKESRFNCFTFVITTADAWHRWDHRRKDLRRRFRLATRRISYSKLRDTRKSQALFPFLFAANTIPGIAVTILVDKRIQSLFVTEGKLQPAATEGIDFTSWRPHVYERMMRATHFLALFVAGTCSPGQNIIWITDEDEIAANVERLTQLTHAFGRAIGNLCPHNLGHLRVGTTGTTDSGGLEIEDFAALPDLIGGAVNEVLSGHEREGARLLSSVIVPPPKNLPRKVHDLMDALLDDAAVLRKLVVTITPIEDSTAIRFTEVNFHSQRRLVTP
jgi:hypothetical protein